MKGIQELERLGYRSPLGVRCRDALTGQPVGDGLTATAWPLADPTESRVAYRSPVSGMLGFASLRAALRVRSRAGQPLPWPAPGPQEPYVVRVTDLFRRYLPALVTAGVPAASAVEVALYSAVARPAPSGWAVVRGETRATAGDTALPWSVVDVDTGADVHRTVADERGRFLLYLPYPEALPPLLGSPPLGPGLGAVTWPLTFTVRCEPGALVHLPGARPADPPELASVEGQAPAQVDQAVHTLTFGRPLVLRLTVVPA